ncbi:hypothetical protein GCM10020254_85620 [Streptomyces goshikiensis]
MASRVASHSRSGGGGAGAEEFLGGEGLFAQVGEGLVADGEVDRELAGAGHAVGGVAGYGEAGAGLQDVVQAAGGQVAGAGADAGIDLPVLAAQQLQDQRVVVVRVDVEGGGVARGDVAVDPGAGVQLVLDGLAQEHHVLVEGFEVADDEGGAALDGAVQVRGDERGVQDLAVADARAHPAAAVDLAARLDEAEVGGEGPGAGERGPDSGQQGLGGVVRLAGR